MKTTLKEEEKKSHPLIKKELKILRNSLAQLIASSEAVANALNYAKDVAGHFGLHQPFPNPLPKPRFKK